MPIKYYATRAQETSTTVTTVNPGGNLVLNGASSGYRNLTGAVGVNNTISYYIYRTDASANFEWEIGIGYIASSGGISQLVRQKVISSSNAGQFVGFTAGTKFIEPIISEDRVNSSFLNLEERSSNFTAPVASATYIIDASGGNIDVALPSVSGIEPIIMGFLLNKTSGNQFEQVGAIELIPSGTETINGINAPYDLSIKRDFIQIVSVPSQSGWLVIDPIQDSTVAYGNLGTIQFANDQAFSGVASLSWEPVSSSLLVGGSGTVTSADIILPTSTQTVVFNEQSLDKDLRVEGSGTTHLLFVDASTNNIGINSTNLIDKLTITSTSGSGISVQASGSGPSLSLRNTATSGVMTNKNVGNILFKGVNNSGSPIDYAEIYARAISTTNGAEKSAINMSVYNDGSKENVASLGASGITLGFNSENVNGIVLGSISSNEGENIVVGYNNNVCGSNCVVLGNSSAISSGTFGGLVGLDHTASGNNIWVIGGSGVAATGNNSLYLAIDNLTYIKLQDKNKLRYTTQSTNEISLGITNTAILSSGIDESLSLEFTNASGVQKTGLVLTNKIVSVTNGSENTAFAARILQDGSSTQVIRAEKNNIVLGKNTSSGNNIVYGHDNSTLASGNILYGKNISTSGTANVLVGQNISITGDNSTILGSNNTCGESGNLGIIMVGNNNTANEDYVVAVGDNNAGSGLYSVACGYNNGAHAEYAVAVGSNNLAFSRASVLVGRSNSASGTSLDSSIFTVGVGNTVNISNSGVVVGYENNMRGSGGFICGNQNSSSGNNNILLGRSLNVSGINNVVLGNNISYSGSNAVIVSGSSAQILGSSITFSGSSITQSATSSNFLNIASTGISAYGPTKIISSGNSLDVSDTGITLLGSGIILNQINSNNKTNISSTGTEIYGSDVNLYGTSSLLAFVSSANRLNVTSTGTNIFGTRIVNSANSSNNIIVASTGVDTLGTRINSSVDSSNNIVVASTGTDVCGSRVLLRSASFDHRINIAITGIDIFGNTIALRPNTGGQILSFADSLNSSSISITGLEFNGSRIVSRVDSSNISTIASTGISTLGTRILNFVGSANNISVASTGTDIYGTKVLIQSNSDNRINIASTGVDIFGSGIIALRGSGQIINSINTTNYISVATTGAEIYGTPITIKGSGTNQINVTPSGTSVTCSGTVMTVTSSGIAYSGFTTTGGGSTLVIENNMIRASTSSERYKENIRVYDRGLSDISKLDPVYFNFKGNPTTRAGLIAERVAASGLEEFVVREENGVIESVNYHHMIVLLINAIKELQKEIEDIKSKI